MPGDTSRFVYTVGENNFYREYDVAVLAFNAVGNGPISDTARIRSAMARKYTHHVKGVNPRLLYLLCNICKTFFWRELPEVTNVFFNLHVM